METSKKIILAGIDITDEVNSWNERNPNTPIDLETQFTDALAKAKTIDELQALKKYLLEHQEELKDLQPSVMELTGDNIKDMASSIDQSIYNMKYRPGVMVVY